MIRARDVSAETPAAAAAPAADGRRPPAAARRRSGRSSDLADGLVAVAESFLAGKVAGADDAEVYQVVVHAGTGVLAGPPVPAPAAERPGVSAETPPAPARVPGDPADPARCHVEDGPAISVSTAQMIACTAALSWMTHGDAGAVLALGRRRRRPSSAIRRAARERDGCRCRFPGLRVPPDRPAPHPALGQRRPHRPGQPDQPVPLAPQGGPRPRLPHRRPATAAARSPSTARTAPRCPPARPCPSPTAASAKPTTRTSPRTRSSRPGTASAST